MFSLIFFAFLTLTSRQEGEVHRDPARQSGQTIQRIPTTPQEELLAELLAEQPENRRAVLIARALANSRNDTETTAEKTLSESQTAQLESALLNLRKYQQAVAKEVNELRRESQILKDRLDKLAVISPRELNVAPQSSSHTFVLPNFERGRLPFYSGPYVNQPSGPMIALQPPNTTETGQAITLELAQLSRDMFRLNQRLQQLQADSEISKGPMDLNRREQGSTGQANRASPLLPR